MRRVFPILFAILSMFASANELADYLAPLGEHPGLMAASAQVASARANVRIAREPLSLTLSAGMSRANVNDDAVSQLPPMPETQIPPTQVSQFSADLQLRPVPFGDVADLVDQREIQLEQALIDWREAVSMLQVQALEAAFSLHLARDGLALAEEAALLARTALEATALRVELGVATETELREAQLAATEADGLVLTATSGLHLAELAVRSLVGHIDIPPREQLWLPLPDPQPVSVQRADLTARLALIGARNMRRSLLPVAQAGYTHHIDDYNSVEISIESRTLQPGVSYTHQSVARAFPENLADGIFQIGVSATIPVSIGSQLASADAQASAGAAAVESARSAASVQLAGLRHDLAEAEARLEVADFALRNSEAHLAEVLTREELGLGVPLETMQASIGVVRAGFELQQARLAHFSASLAFHTHNAQPILEVTRP